MTARPTILSTILGILALALSGPMLLLSTVDDENCPSPGTTEARACSDLLTDGDFWQRVAASGLGSIAEPWQSLTALLLPMFGIPLFLSSVRRGDAGEPEPTLEKTPPTSNPGS